MIFDSNKYKFIKNLYGNRAILLESLSTKDGQWNTHTTRRERPISQRRPNVSPTS